MSVLLHHTLEVLQKGGTALFTNSTAGTSWVD